MVAEFLSIIEDSAVTSTLSESPGPRAASARVSSPSWTSALRLWGCIPERLKVTV